MGEITDTFDEVIEELEVTKKKLIRRLSLKLEHEGLAQDGSILSLGGEIITLGGCALAFEGDGPRVPIERYEEAREKIGAIGNDLIEIADLLRQILEIYRRLQRLEKMVIKKAI